MTQPFARRLEPRIWPFPSTRQPDSIHLSWQTVYRELFAGYCPHSQMDCRKSHGLCYFSAHYSCSQRGLTRLSLRQGSPPRLARQNVRHPLALAYSVSMSLLVLNHRLAAWDHLALCRCFLHSFQPPELGFRTLSFDCRLAFDYFAARASFCVPLSQSLVWLDSSAVEAQNRQGPCFLLFRHFSGHATLWQSGLDPPSLHSFPATERWAVFNSYSLRQATNYLILDLCHSSCLIWLMGPRLGRCRSHFKETGLDRPVCLVPIDLQRMLAFLKICSCQIAPHFCVPPRFPRA